MKISRHLLNALSGWVAGIVITLLFGFLWKNVFPVVDGTGQGASLPYTLGFILLIISFPAIAGGVIGGRVIKEGGHNEQIRYAAIIGALATLPFSCFLFWYLAW
jgi:hypothetical protein